MNGTIHWIGIRPERKAPVIEVQEVRADQENGLEGDHPAKPDRQVTLIFREALDEAAAILGKPAVRPADTRRNILISGLNYNLNNGSIVRLGTTEVVITGPCLPCERMNQTLGEGGRQALANAVAGGLTARIVKSGRIRIGDDAVVESEGPERRRLPG